MAPSGGPNESGPAQVGWEAQWPPPPAPPQLRPVPHQHLQALWGQGVQEGSSTSAPSILSQDLRPRDVSGLARGHTGVGGRAGASAPEAGPRQQLRASQPNQGLIGVVGPGFGYIRGSGRAGSLMPGEGATYLHLCSHLPAQWLPGALPPVTPQPPPHP